MNIEGAVRCHREFLVAKYSVAVSKVRGKREAHRREDQEKDADGPDGRRSSGRMAGGYCPPLQVWIAGAVIEGVWFLERHW